MGSLGVPELLMIFVVALLLFGPRKMPEIGKSIGRALGEFRRASNDFKRTIEEEVAAEEIRDVQREVQSSVAESRRVLSGASSPSPVPSTGADQASRDQATRDQARGAGSDAESGCGGSGGGESAAGGSAE